MDISAESSTDGQLMAAVRTHDQQALAERYVRYRGRVFACAYAITRDRMVAEEVAQDVFHALWQSAANFHSERSVAAWITGITRHRAVDATRTSHFRARHREYTIGTVGAGALTQHGHEACALDRVEITRAIRLLPTAQAAVVLACHAGCSAREIAARAGVPIGTIKTRLRLGVRRMRIELRAG